MTITLQAVNELIQSLESAGELSIKERKYLELAKAYQQLAAENVALANPDNWLAQSDYGYEASEVATGNGASESESLRAGMVAIINRIKTASTSAYLAEVRSEAQSEVIEWLDAEITAIDTMYRGDPSYERDAYWMKSEVLDVVELARKAFVAQVREGAK
ncbi:hypothetical protein HA444_07565 [Klebsiella grimontii]|uniref:hypothetical protein n=1 Tax=Klebsiella grimontii TaxID=2058152 RepID=UPI001665DF54|nr:hypothetical protein [Klebsiella grimontii]MBD0902474.1 hypothetical protein [Klebsiella grimontii]